MDNKSWATRNRNVMLFFSYSTKKYAIIDGKQIIMKKIMQ
mgnify:CR=1 FL=1